MTKEQVIPKWFDGSVYASGATVQNPFSGEKYELNNTEYSMYRYVIHLNDIIWDRKSTPTKKQLSNFQRGLTWFRKNNPEAYYVLLD